ncbi:aa3-type cytochrome c oxidase subunit IV [Falsiroseomonas stagni]|uniref:Aa3 type cytochrome c oxidase subunit IV n=1 Tax=Falsiroseomonas stagni DSM 19981 TaxID=1123062 RepID=A0A1I3YAE8_9PROT|nr:aa3-type cytochrome c oxidase subunit IV [Falsiroseomonas stagni]SFK28838.1 aa3 type cytochrome c oxidase subunit IV [Falsiroseomonas stagni DSM 19981]
MADHAPATYELVEVKAEDIMAERTSFYDGFLKGTTWGIGLTVGILVLLAIFVV